MWGRETPAGAAQDPGSNRLSSSHLSPDREASARAQEAPRWAPALSLQGHLRPLHPHPTTEGCWARGPSCGSAGCVWLLCCT